MDMRFTMTPVKKTALIALGVLAVGVTIGYEVGVAKDRFEFRERLADGGQRYGMMGGSERGWNAGERGRRDGFGNWNTNKDNDPDLGMMGRGGGMGFGGGMNRDDCLADGCLSFDGLDYPVGTLSDAAKYALSSALDDEYKALATYEAVMAKFGNVRPFVMIARAEENHIAALKAVYDKYGLTIPANPYIGKVAAPESLQAACQTGVDAEIANASLYRGNLLPAVKGYPDIVYVFTNLMNASQNRHLPAFDRCN